MSNLVYAYRSSKENFLSGALFFVNLFFCTTIMRYFTINKRKKLINFAGQLLCSANERRERSEFGVGGQSAGWRINCYGQKQNDPAGLMLIPIS